MFFATPSAHTGACSASSCGPSGAPSAPMPVAAACSSATGERYSWSKKASTTSMSTSPYSVR